MIKRPRRWKSRAHLATSYLPCMHLLNLRMHACIINSCRQTQTTWKRCLGVLNAWVLVVHSTSSGLFKFSFAELLRCKCSCSFGCGRPIYRSMQICLCCWHCAIGDAPEDPLQEEGEESEDETDDEVEPEITCHEKLDLASSPVHVAAASVQFQHYEDWFSKHKYFQVLEDAPDHPLQTEQVKRKLEESPHASCILCISLGCNYFWCVCPIQLKRTPR